MAAALEQGTAVFWPVGTGTGVQVAVEVGAPVAMRVGTGIGVAEPPPRGTGLADGLVDTDAAVGVATGEAPAGEAVG